MNNTLLAANLWTMGWNLVFAILAMMIGLGALRLADKLLFPEIDFVAEIKRGNTAAAILAGAVLLFMALVLSSAVR